jgi:Fe-S-cluster-containing dehydrogenase component/anaerobic selenocysteine-containing dehydrogenase
MGLAGAGTAFAGLTLSGCMRKPREKILPFAKRPEDLVPGQPQYYATAAAIGGGVEGLLVESHEGRPTKIEGNPRHPVSRGASSAWAQAEILGLYDPDRSRRPKLKGKSATWGSFFSAVGGRLEELGKKRGAGLCLLTEYQPSPTYIQLISDLQRQYPGAKVFRHDATFPAGAAEGAAMLGFDRFQPLPRLDRAKVIVALDADPLGADADALRHARDFADGRRAETPKDAMNRLYVAEPIFTPTGTLADHRLRLPASQIGALLIELSRALMGNSGGAPAGAEAVKEVLNKHGAGRWAGWAKALAKDLQRHRGASVVLVGQRQPGWVHALAQLVNELIGAVGTTVRFSAAEDLAAYRKMGSLPELAKLMDAGQVDTLVCVGANPVYDAPADLNFGALVKKAPLSIHLGHYLDETAKACTWHVPRSHFLEAWGDLRAADGTASVQQPLIAPLFDTRSEIEVLAHLAGVKRRRGYELVRRYWTQRAAGDQTKSWRRGLHDGVIQEGKTTNAKYNVVSTVASPGAGYVALAAALKETTPAPQPGGDKLEAIFSLDSSLLDGRYANNGWLQELPDPVTKLTWDNAALFSPATAKRLGVKSAEMVELGLDGRKLTMAAFIVPGTADDVVVLPLGYGRKEPGETARGSGFDVGKLRSSKAPHIAAGLTVRPLGRRYLLASTQDHGSMEGRAIVLEGDLELFRADPEFARKAVKHPPLKSIWKEHEHKGQQWGMSVDLNACTGCNACVVACQAENYIPVVGKPRVLDGREMQWLRIDRYFEGDADDARMLVQPMACQHCELAPCEGVCPVAATVHSPEGLNDMAYNRCIGTRYCSNNCPYKVRRFNFFQYNKGIDPVARMQKNPDVTIRFRGVMEKCSYCVQRINAAKIDAKRDGDGKVRDGAILPACAQACPTKAIVFGDINDKGSAVSRRKAQPRDYTVLPEINVKPRTTYAARVRNPNPALRGSKRPEREDG